MTRHIVNNINICIVPFARGYKALLPIITVWGKLSQSFCFIHVRMLLAKCTPYQHLHCNISHDRYLLILPRNPINELIRRNLPTKAYKLIQNRGIHRAFLYPQL